MGKCGILLMKSNRVARWIASRLSETAIAVMPVGIASYQGKYRKREVAHMDTYQILSLLFLGGNFLMALLTYLDGRNDKRK